MTVTVVAEGIANLRAYLERVPDITREAARLAINDVAAGEGRTAIKQEMLAQVAFPSGYLDQDRLALKQKATANNLEAVIEGRQRPTSLARFATGGAVGVRGARVRVRVKPGAGKALQRAFLVRLRAGASLTADNYNVGLAVRLRPGEQLANKKVTTQRLDSGVHILYGPSVDQVFRTVADDVAPAIADQVTGEFYRQFVRLSEER